MGQVNLKITAEDRATAVLEKMAASGKNASDRLQGAFDQLGVKTSSAFDRQRQAAQGAYDRIKASGVATADELQRAQKTLAGRLKQIDEEQFGKRTSLLQKFKTNWLAVTASLGAAWVTVSRGFALAEEAASGLQKRQSFANLAASHGASADKILADLKRVSAGTIATQELIEKAGTSMLLGIEANALPKLMEIARASSRITGQTITKSFEDISLAVGRQSRMILDNLGIIVQQEQANEKYAAVLGKTASELTEAERKQAFLNATLDAGQEIIDRVGISADTMAEKLQRMRANMADAREAVGRLILAVGSGLYGAFMVAAGSLHMAVGLITYLPSAIVNLLSKIPLVGRAFRGLASDLDGFNSAAFETAGESYQAALDNLSTSWDVISGKIDGAAAASSAMEGATSAAGEEVQKKTEALKNASTALDRYSKQISDLGREQLKMAQSGFSRDLERQEEFFKKTGVVASNLAAPIRNYISVLDEVYGAQLEAQKEIAATLEKIGAEDSERMQQQINVATTEKTAVEARLKGWQSYYDKLKAMHASAMETMAKSQEELLAVQQFGEDLSGALADKFNPQVALDPMEQYFRQLERIDADQARAMEATGQKRVDMLQAAMSKLKDLPTEVKAGDTVVISSMEIYEQAMRRFEQMQSAAEAAKSAEIAAAGEAAARLEAEMATAQRAMADLQDQVLALDDRIGALSKSVTLSLNDQASQPITQIQTALDRLQDKTITITANYVSNIPGGASAASSSLGRSDGPLFPGLVGSYATGTPYVPRTGLALVHQGERIIPAEENRKGGYGNITIAPQISITMQGGSSPERTARELAREIEPELRKLGERYARG